MLRYCVKRDGTKAEFREEKIALAIFRAAKAVGGSDYGKAEKMARQVVERLEEKGSDTVHLEDIQDMVEKVLIDNRHTTTAKAYIIYREKRRATREGNALVDATVRLFRSYLDDMDWKTHENANMQRALGGLNQYVRESFTRTFWENEVYPKEVVDMWRDNMFHIHDAGSFSAYCAGFDCRQILTEGFGGVSGKVQSKPPKHLRTFLGQLVNATFTLAGEIAGAVAWSSLDTYAAPFIRFDNLSYDEVHDAVEEFVFNLNIATRVGFQAPFSNITLDQKCPSTLAGQGVIIGGEVRRESYDQFQHEQDMFNMALCEVMCAGDAKGRVFTFPVITVSITKDTDWDSPITDKIFEMSCKYGIPYFSNYISSDLSPEDALSMCPLTGDTQVVTRSRDGVVSARSIRTVYKAQALHGERFEVWDGQAWRKARATAQPMTRVLEVRAGGATVRMGENHLQPTRDNGTLKASELEKGMALPFEPLSGPDDTPGGSRAWADIERITEVPCSDDSLYCFEVDVPEGQEPLFMLASGLLTHNCRLRLDKRELRKRNGGLFGSAPLTGSVGIVTLNTARMAYLAKDEDEFFGLLEKAASVARTSLEIKRKVVEAQFDNGLYPYLKHHLEGIKKRTGRYLAQHFSTLGVCGLSETCENLFGKGVTIATEEGRSFALRVLDWLRDYLTKCQEETGDMWNLEATPAESTAYRFARRDKEDFLDIITAGTEDVPYYTNSCHLPVGYTDDLFETLELQDELQQKFTGGTVIHAYLPEAVPDIEAAKSFIKTAFENYGLPYLSLTPSFSICPSHGYLKGEQWTCPECGVECEVWSRVVGYLRPVQNYNKGKRQEATDRLKYRLPEAAV